MKWRPHYIAADQQILCANCTAVSHIVRILYVIGLSLFFPYKDSFSRSQKSKIVYKASCWDCDSFYIGKTKRRIL